MSINPLQAKPARGRHTDVIIVGGGITGAGVLREAVALDDLKRFERMRTDQRRAAKRRAVCAGPEDVLQRFAGPNGAHR